jgi:hypothetical protein
LEPPTREHDAGENHHVLPLAGGTNWRAIGGSICQIRNSGREVTDFFCTVIAGRRNAEKPVTPSESPRSADFAYSASEVIAKLTGVRRREVYQRALSERDQN